MKPEIKIVGQYTKDLSFENPNAPGVFLTASKNSPDINVSVNIGSIKLKTKEGHEDSSFYEISLKIDVEAKIKVEINPDEKKEEDMVAFKCELEYCAVLSVTHCSEDDLKELLLIKGPSLLFPFAREVIARNISSGGFPPLMIDVIDFEKMYREQLTKDKNKNKNI